MELNEYQRQARRTIPADWDSKRMIEHASYKIPGEAGEIADIFGKEYQGHPVDSDKLIEEAGDLLWHVAELATGLGVTLEEIARRNQEKLWKRYPDGFDADRSVNRSTDGYRQADWVEECHQ